MADFRGTILTQRGRNLLAKAQTGTTLTFTKIKLGDGLWISNTDPTQLNDLVSPKLNLPIQEIRVVGDGTVRLRFVLTNTGLSQGFFMREIGIYAQDPALGEILYAVAYAGDRADFIPSDGVTKVENVVDIYTVIANAQNVTAVISDSVVLATKQDINTVKPEASSTAPNLTYPGKLWVDAASFLKYFDGSNWKNVKASFADTVDGFHASLTPAPNVIVPLDMNGVLDLSASYVKSSDYAFRRINGDNLTSDYLLQIGEEIIYTWDTTKSLTKPLYIANAGGWYEMDIVFPVYTGVNGRLFLYPNNTVYVNAFTWGGFSVPDGVAPGGGSGTSSGFYLHKAGLSGYTKVFVSTFVACKMVLCILRGYHPDFNAMSTLVIFSSWNDITTYWTSFGTLVAEQPNSEAFIRIRRLY